MMEAVIKICILVSVLYVWTLTLWPWKSNKKFAYSLTHSFIFLLGKPPEISAKPPETSRKPPENSQDGGKLRKCKCIYPAQNQVTLSAPWTVWSCGIRLYVWISTSGVLTVCAPLISFTGGRGCASVCLGGLKSARPCWSGRAQSCLADWKGRAPVGQGTPKVAVLIEKGAPLLIRARPKLPYWLKRAPLLVRVRPKLPDILERVRSCWSELAQRSVALVGTYWFSIQCPDGVVQIVSTRGVQCPQLAADWSPGSPGFLL